MKAVDGISGSKRPEIGGARPSLAIPVRQSRPPERIQKPGRRELSPGAARREIPHAGGLLPPPGTPQTREN